MNDGSRQKPNAPKAEHSRQPAPMSREEAIAECEGLDAQQSNKFTEHVPVELQPGIWRAGSRQRADWQRFSDSDRLDRPVKKGDRFVVPCDVEIQISTHWFAPFTGGHIATLPAGTILIANYDQRPGYPGFSCVPEDYHELETTLVPFEDRKDPKYSGYSLSFVLDDIGTKIEER